jgi:hypothetical protein
MHWCTPVQREVPMRWGTRVHGEASPGTGVPQCPGRPPPALNCFTHAKDSWMLHCWWVTFLVCPLPHSGGPWKSVSQKGRVFNITSKVFWQEVRQAFEALDPDRRRLATTSTTTRTPTSPLREEWTRAGL